LGDQLLSGANPFADYAQRETDNVMVKIAPCLAGLKFQLTWGSMASVYGAATSSDPIASFYQIAAGTTLFPKPFFLQGTGPDTINYTVQ
jgi:hypothetical protein